MEDVTTKTEKISGNRAKIGELSGDFDTEKLRDLIAERVDVKAVAEVRAALARGIGVTGHFHAKPDFSEADEAAIMQDFWARSYPGCGVTAYANGVESPLLAHTMKTTSEALLDMKELMDSISPHEPDIDLFLFTESQWEEVQKQLPVKTADSSREAMLSQFAGFPVEVVAGVFEFFERSNKLEKAGKRVGILPLSTLSPWVHTPGTEKYSECKRKKKSQSPTRAERIDENE